jgi:lipopolysaccharide transport system ATP-binding protein
MFSIKTMCDRVIYLKNGQVHFDGPTDQGIELYESDCRLGAVPWARIGGLDDGAVAPITITDVALMDEAGVPKSVFDYGERMRLRLDYRVSGPVAAPNFIVALVRSDGVACCNYSTALDGVDVQPTRGDGRIELLTPPLSLVSELYRIEILVRENGFERLVCGQLGGSFHVRHPVFDMHFGVFHEAGAWTCRAERPAMALRDEAMEVEL